MNYHFKIYEEENGYWGECLEIDSCHSQGNTLPELRKMLKEALDLTLNEPAGSNMVFPMPDPQYDSVKDVLIIPVDNNIAFALLVRQNRISKQMTQAEAQKAMGLPNRTSYTRLESKGNPTFSTIEKLLKAFPDFPLEECLPIKCVNNNHQSI